MTGRRFPPPWRMIKKPGCFQVQDATGHSIGWFYSDMTTAPPATPAC